MFREMRRSKQQLSEDECLEILKKEQTAVLGVLGDDGWPYTVPLNYVYAGGKLYIHGAKSGHKLDAMRACDKVSLCVIERDDVVGENFTTAYRSVIVFGRARVLEREEEIRAAATALGMKYYPHEDAVAASVAQYMPALCCIEITPEHITGKEGMELHKLRKT